jgi:hypothetical protein
MVILLNRMKCVNNMYRNVVTMCIKYGACVCVFYYLAFGPYRCVSRPYSCVADMWLMGTADR